MLTASGRYDGSSKFPKDSRFGFFPSFSAGWRISREGFMKWSDPVLSNLTLRASWGNIGNQNIGAYAYIPEMVPGKSGWIVNDKPTYTVGAPSLVSADFTWERVQTLNLGVDLALFDNRFDAIFDWYQRDTKGMLDEGVELPSVLGAAAPLENVANLRTKGWGLQVNWRDHFGQVAYHVGFTLSDRNTYITKINNEVGLLSDYYVGQNINEQWGYVTDRYYTEADFDADGNLLPGIPRVEGYTPKPGDILYKDFNDDGLINSGNNTLNDPGDRKIIGDRGRHYQYGITGGLSWKGISFSFILQGVGQRDMWNDSNLFWPFGDAEAMCELGKFDQAVADRTINLMRRRPSCNVADMDVDAITAAGRSWDPALETGGYYNRAADPVLWEIRRERRLEFVGEGFAFRDIRRWKIADLVLNKRPQGAWIDRNVYGGNLTLQDIDGNTLPADAQYGYGAYFGKPSGWLEHYYLYPLPLNNLVLNEALEQNPGWTSTGDAEE